MAMHHPIQAAMSIGKRNHGGSVVFAGRFPACSFPLCQRFRNILNHSRLFLALRNSMVIMGWEHPE